jgi:hypothetical protein
LPVFSGKLMIPASWLQKEIFNKWFFGIPLGLLVGIAVVVILVNLAPLIGLGCCGMHSLPTDIQVMKLDAGGKVQWETRIDGGDDAWPSDIIQTPDGGYAISGNFDSFAVRADGMRSWIIRLNRSGDVEWSNTYSWYMGQDRGLFVNPDGGFFSSRFPGKILTLDTKGMVTREMPFGEDDFNTLFAPVTDRGFYVLQENISRSNSAIIRIDRDGRETWRHDNISMSVVSEETFMVTSDGGCLIGGINSNPLTKHLNALYYVRFDSSGNEVWNATVGKIGDTRPLLIAESRLGIYEIIYESTRNSDTPPAIVMETFSVTYNDKGEVLRQRMLDISPPITKISEQDYLAVRLSEKPYGESGGGGHPHTIVRLDDEGLIKWQTPVSTTWFDVSRIVPTDDGGCVVLGFSIQNLRLSF